MIILRPERLHWITDNCADDPHDLCAHSPVSCQINDEIICSPDDGDWTVSASAIFLLRALERDHTMESKVGDQVFPCCGHGIYDVGEPEVVICGCPSGVDFEIRHIRDHYEITTSHNRKIEIPEKEWIEAVVNYSEQILSFYRRSSQKVPSDQEEIKGFSLMMNEWQRLHSKYSNAEQGGGGNRLKPVPHL